MQQSAALYVFFTQLRVMRALFSNTEQYAVKLVNDSPEAIQFKNLKTIPALQQMLNKMCTKTAPPPGSLSSRTAYQSLQLSQRFNPGMGLSATCSTAATVLVAQTAGHELMPPTGSTAPASEQPSQMINQLKTNQLMNINIATAR